MRVTKPRKLMNTASRRTLQRRCNEAKKICNILTANESSALLFEEIKSLNKDAKAKLLKDAGIINEIGAQQVLAIKAELAIPWNKIRDLRR